jgi:hypothetical protein
MPGTGIGSLQAKLSKGPWGRARQVQLDNFQMERYRSANLPKTPTHSRSTGHLSATSNLNPKLLSTLSSTGRRSRADLHVRSNEKPTFSRVREAARFLETRGSLCAANHPLRKGFALNARLPARTLQGLFARGNSLISGSTHGLDFMADTRGVK